jgi:hypothetical protein
VQEDFGMSAATFNSVAADGRFDLQMRPSRSIDPGTCAEEDGTQAYIELSYMYRSCELSSPSLSSKASICTPTLYDQSSGEMNLDSAGVASFVFTDLELATGNVELTYFHKGDDSPNGYYDLLVEEVFTIGTSEPGDAGACDAFTASPIVLNEDQFNSYFAESDSSLTVSMDYDDDFGGNDCVNSKVVYFNLKYQEAGCSVESQEPSSDPVPAPTATPSPMPSSKPSPAEYEQSSDAMTLDSGGSASHVFMNLELAKGNVEVTYYHKGDDSDSYYDLKVGDFFSLGESVAGNSVPCEVYTASIKMVSPEEFNNVYLSDSSSLRVSMTYDDLGGNSCTAGKEVVFKLKYVEADGPMVQMPSEEPSSSQPTMCIPTVFDQSSATSGVDSDGVAQFEFSGLKPADGNVVITYFHRNDDSGSYYDLKVAELFVVGDSDPNSDVCETYIASARTISKDQFNDVYGVSESSSLSASMHYDDFGGNTCPNDKEVYVNLNYQEAGC